MYRGEIWWQTCPLQLLQNLDILVQSYSFRVRIISIMEPRRREGHEGRSHIKSVGIGIIYLSIL